MRFYLDGAKVICRRVEKTSKGEVLVDVVEFDAQLNAVPPHVMAQLTPHEKTALELFLVDRERLQAKSEPRVILEALPTLIDKVRGVLVSVGQIDNHLHQKLTTASDRLEAALLEVRVEQGEGKEDVNSLNTEEALKARLDIISRGL